MEYLIIIIIILLIVILYLVRKIYSHDYYSSNDEMKPIIKTVNSDTPTKGLDVNTGHDFNREENITLGEEQLSAYEFVSNNMGIFFITGKAGTGKSQLLRYMAKHLGKNTVIVAPTGVAALNVGGQTIHSFFKLSFEVQQTSNIKLSPREAELIGKIECLIIDEISMVSVDVLEAINKKMQLSRGNKLPFGGVRIVLFGDLYQLPPVVKDGEVKKYLTDTYGGIFFFYAPVLKNVDLKIIELNHNYRQSDSKYLEILNNIRHNNKLPSTLIELNRRVSPNIDRNNMLTLCSNNNQVSSINKEMLSTLSTKEYKYEASIEGNVFERDFPTDRTLQLRVGAQVMLLKNDISRPMRWVNGTIGIVTKLTDDYVWVTINKIQYQISKAKWEKYKYFYNHQTKNLEQEIIGTFEQFPLKLAWAITIHKSQGQTYSRVIIDLGTGAFQPGQVYVALSRCKTLDGLYLSKPIREKDIEVNDEVVRYMEKNDDISVILDSIKT